jgi:hypothetical protein
MQRSQQLPFSGGDTLGWARYGNLNLPPEIAALLGVSAPARLDGHVDTGLLPVDPLNRPQIFPGAAGGVVSSAADGQMGSEDESSSSRSSSSSSAQLPAVHPAPPVVARKRLATGSRRCGQCQTLGHTKRTCPQLGHVARDVNTNALSVQPLASSRRHQASPAEVFGAAPGVLPARAVVRDGSSGSSYSGSGSGSESLSDTDADEGFKDVRWNMLYNSALPRSDSNSIEGSPSLFSPDRSRRRPDSGSPPAASPSLQGAPEFSRPNDEPRARRIPRTCTTAMDFVQLMFPIELVDTLVMCTNAAATGHPRLTALQRYTNWKSTTRKEMYVFLAICIYLGVVKVQNRKLVWKHGGVFEQTWVSSRMTLRRFEGLLNAFNCCMHWHPHVSDDDYATKTAADPFWQIKSFVEQCNEKSRYHFKMGRSFSIDEAVIPFKGRHKARCYNPKKPAKYHLKKFSLNCAKTGYVYAHYHYGGKDERRPAGVSASLWPIKKLVDDCPDLHSKGHLCATDNWYTSAQSLAYLRRRGIHSVGTIKRSRLCVATAKQPTGFPASATFKGGRGQPKRARGECQVHSTRLDGGDAYVTTWQDKKAVCVLSSYRPGKGVCSRRIQVGRQWTRQEFFRPNVIAHYNDAMGGTDLHDQRLAFVRSTVKSRRWQV